MISFQSRWAVGPSWPVPIWSKPSVCSPQSQCTVVITAMVRRRSWWCGYKYKLWSDPLVHNYRFEAALGAMHKSMCASVGNWGLQLLHHPRLVQPAGASPAQDSWAMNKETKEQKKKREEARLALREMVSEIWTHGCKRPAGTPSN